MAGNLNSQNAVIAVALLIGCFTVAYQVTGGQKTVGDFVLFVTVSDSWPLDCS